MEVHQNEDILALHQLTKEELQSMKDEALRDISDLERLVFQINRIMETQDQASLWDDMVEGGYRYFPNED